MFSNISITLLLASLPILASAQAQVAESLRQLNCAGSTGVAGGGLRPTFYVPETGQICEMMDCGGGRAPPKYNVPGCNAYTGTASYTKLYMPGWGPDGKIAAPTGTAASQTSTTQSTITPAPKVGTTPTDGGRANKPKATSSTAAKPALYTGGANVVGGSVVAIGLGLMGAIAAL